MIVGARAATASDLPALAHLAASAAAGLGSERGGPLFLARELGGGDVGATLGALAADESALLAAGTVDEIVLGLAVARLETLEGAPLARLHVIWVEPGARGVGVGGELVAFVAAWAGSRGADRVDAYALPGDRATKNLFESAGYSARLIVMHRAGGAP
ncbi:MAG TPA: GNAT family N-acetyltransferase [Acidimicrobiales bacterium]|nr:GNAT family N-acetyltransferase [Acidimicrobiales bacterium]